MNETLFKILFNNKSNSTHSKIALDAAKNIKDVPNAEKWIEFFLYFNDEYMKGSRAPDREFKDYKNHVLHVEENFWGGAPAKTLEWFGRYVTSLKEKRWKDAAYAAAVMTHYYSDPQQPLHTGQTEEEGKVHKFYEWGILQSYPKIQEIIVKKGGIKKFQPPQGEDWVIEMVKEGAIKSHEHYWTVIDHFNIKKGRKKPAEGVDQYLLEVTAEILQRVISGSTYLIEEGIRKANVEPPKMNLTLKTFIEVLKMPKYWITRKISDAKTRRLIEKTYQEIEEKGKVIENLGEDDKEVRREHAKEVLKIPIEKLNKQPAKPTGTKFGKIEEREPEKHSENVKIKQKTVKSKTVKTRVLHKQTLKKEKTKIKKEETKSEKKKEPEKVEEPEKKEPEKVEEPEKKEPEKVEEPEKKEPEKVEEPEKKEPEKEDKKREKRKLKYYLSLSDPVDAAPEIGKKTAARLNNAGINTVKDLIEANAKEIHEEMKKYRIKVEDIERWQKESKLQIQMPNLRGYDVQLLVRAGFETPESIEKTDNEIILERILEVAHSKKGEWILRNKKIPDMKKVEFWKDSAKNSRPLQ